MTPFKYRKLSESRTSSRMDPERRGSHRRVSSWTAEYIEITPERYWSWGIDSPTFDQGKPVTQRLLRELEASVTLLKRVELSESAPRIAQEHFHFWRIS